MKPRNNPRNGQKWVILGAKWDMGLKLEGIKKRKIKKRKKALLNAKEIKKLLKHFETKRKKR